MESPVVSEKESYKKPFPWNFLYLLLALFVLILLVAYFFGAISYVRRLMFAQSCVNTQSEACSSQVLLISVRTLSRSSEDFPSAQPDSRNGVLAFINNNQFYVWTTDGLKVYKLSSDTTFGVSVAYKKGDSIQKQVDRIASRYSVNFTTQKIYGKANPTSDPEKVISYSEPVKIETFKKIVKSGNMLDFAYDDQNNLLGAMVIDLNR